MKITIVCVGKIKEKFYRDALDEYAKRLSKYCKYEIIEVADEKTPDKASPAEEEQIKEREAQRILSKIKPDAFVCTLEIAGKELSSVEFADYIERLTVGGKTKFACVDGPDFDGFEVDFDEAMQRGAMYKPFEAHAREAACNLLKKEVE